MKAIKIILPIIFISFLLININVVYFGDDYHFLGFHTNDFSAYMQDLYTHYTLDNGRLIVHFLDSIFLKVPVLWQILNSFMLTFICYIIGTLTSKNNVAFTTSITFVLISLLDILLLNQSVYWITGSFNYIYPMFCFLVYWFFLNRVEKKNSYFVIAIIFGILASASVEQAGMMAFGLTLLTLITKFDGFKNLFRNNKRVIILLFVTLIGLCTVVLSPSQFIRFNTATEIPFMQQVLQNSKLIITSFSVSKSILPFMLLFNLFTIFIAYKNKNKLVICSSVVNILLSLYCIIVLNGVFSTFTIISIFIILFSYLISIIYLNKTIYNKLFSPLTIALILMVGSQFMMIVSPVVGYRNMIFGLIMFAYIICLIAPNIKKYNNITVILLLVIGIGANIHTALGYHETKKIDDKNIEIINNYNGTDSEIILYKFTNDYCWSMPYISPFHEQKFKEHYNLNCEIIWQ